MIFSRWRRSKGTAPRRTPAERALDALLTEQVAAHFPAPRVEGTTVSTGIAGLRIDCRTGQVGTGFDDEVAVPLFLELSGGGFGPRRRFASVSGYGETPEAAVAEGACAWVCTFGPVLGQGLTGIEDPDLTGFELERDGRRYSAVVHKMDRVWTFSLDGAPAAEAEGIFERARSLLGGTPMITPRIVARGELPPFTEQHTLVSVFVMLTPETVTYEVKVNGVDWEPACLRDEPAEGIPGALLLLRELAVVTLVPQEESDDPEDVPPLTRDEVETRLGVLGRRTGPGWAAGWPGWERHRGFAGTPLSTDAVAGIEQRTGPLSPDYRRFLLEVAGPGAGPGYGLCEPARVGDRLAVAHAGCGATWVLRLDPEHHGEVWLDATSNHDTYVRVAASFTDWFRRWLAESVVDRPWVQWDLTACPVGPMHANTRRTLLRQHPDGVLTFQRVGSMHHGSAYLPDGMLDPCQGCADLVYRLSGRDTEFEPGPLRLRG